VKRIIGLDPGGTTGVVIWTEGGWTTEPTSGPPEWFIIHLGPEEHHEELYAMLEREHVSDTTVVCESFEFRQGKQRAGINLMSREYIGVAKLFAQQRSDVTFVLQTAATAKAFIDDKKLRVMGLYYPGHRHAMDAMRHVLTYRIQKLRHHDLIESWKKL
jgi:hypothetical protein